jgi:hypothetical protein
MALFLIFREIFMRPVSQKLSSINATVGGDIGPWADLGFYASEQGMQTEGARPSNKIVDIV